MKTAAAVCASSASAKAPSPPARKHRRPGDRGEEEMQACFARLMQLVPTVAPNNGRMSKVQLLQHVIDYILDLEYTLDFRPSAVELSSVGKAENADWVTTADGGRAPGSPPPTTTATTTAPSPTQLNAVDRKPLTENAQVNSSRGHHHHHHHHSAQQQQQQTSYFERQPSITWS